MCVCVCGSFTLNETGSGAGILSRSRFLGPVWMFPHCIMGSICTGLPQCEWAIILMCTWVEHVPHMYLTKPKLQHYGMKLTTSPGPQKSFFLRKDEVMTLYVKNTVQKISFDTSEATIPVTTFRRCPMFNVFSVSGKIHVSYRSKVNTPSTYVLRNTCKYSTRGILLSCCYEVNCYLWCN